MAAKSTRKKSVPTRPVASARFNPNKGRGDGGIEVRFPSKPAAATRKSLSAAGFIWSQRLGLWFALGDNRKAAALARRIDPSFNVR